MSSSVRLLKRSLHWMKTDEEVGCLSVYCFVETETETRCGSESPNDDPPCIEIPEASGVSLSTRL